MATSLLIGAAAFSLSKGPHMALSGRRRRHCICPGQPGSASHSQPAPERSVAREPTPMRVVGLVRIPGRRCQGRGQCSAPALHHSQNHASCRGCIGRQTSERTRDHSRPRAPSAATGEPPGRRPEPTRKVNRAEVAACGPRLWALARSATRLLPVGWRCAACLRAKLAAAVEKFACAGDWSATPATTARTRKRWSSDVSGWMVCGDSQGRETEPSREHSNELRA